MPTAGTPSVGVERAAVSAPRAIAAGAPSLGPTPFVVVPRSAAIQAAEDALSVALVAIVTGTRPRVSTLDIYEALQNRFSISRANVDVRGHEPEDFLVRFRHGEDRDRVLASRGWGASPTTTLETMVTSDVRDAECVQLQSCAGAQEHPRTCQKCGCCAKGARAMLLPGGDDCCP